jgi:hypothetical protein
LAWSYGQLNSVCMASCVNIGFELVKRAETEGPRNSPSVAYSFGCVNSHSINPVP